MEERVLAETQSCGCVGLSGLFLEAKCSSGGEQRAGTHRLEGHTQEFALYPTDDGEVLKGGNELTMSYP